VAAQEELISLADHLEEGAACACGEFGGVRPMRTSLRLAVNVGLQAAPSLRHSSSAAVLLTLKMCRLERLRS